MKNEINSKWLKPHTNKFTQLIFTIISNLSRVYKQNKFKIDSIEKNAQAGYLVNFIYIGKRQRFKESASNIFLNDSLIKIFSPEEAAIIGYFHACSHIEKLNNNWKEI